MFTTHATLLGRYLAMNDPNFYDHLMQVDWEAEARNFNRPPLPPPTVSCGAPA